MSDEPNFCVVVDGDKFTDGSDILLRLACPNLVRKPPGRRTPVFSASETASILVACLLQRKPCDSVNANQNWVLWSSWDTGYRSFQEQAALF